MPRPWSLILSAPLLGLVWAQLAAAGDEAAFRFFVPSDVTVREESPAPQEAFAQASSQGDFGVKIELELIRSGVSYGVVPLSTPICNGDFIAFRFTPSAAGYATVVNHGTSGAWSRIWPAQKGEDSSFGPQQAARLPGQESPGFPVSGPPGGDHVMIFFSPTPFSAELKKLQDRLVRQEEAAAGAVARAETGGGTRAVQITHLSDLGVASAVYVVGQGEQTVAFTLDHRASCPELP